jgi:uncharacterized membrane protein
MILVDFYLLMGISFAGYGIFSNANGSHSLNGVYVFDYFYPLISLEHIKILTGWMVNYEDKYIVGEYLFNFFTCGLLLYVIIFGFWLSFIMCYNRMQKYLSFCKKKKFHIKE